MLSVAFEIRRDTYIYPISVRATRPLLWIEYVFLYLMLKLKYLFYILTDDIITVKPHNERKRKTRQVLFIALDIYGMY